MSKRAESLTWERSRAGKSELLMLVKIADLADDDGRNAWVETPALARWIRSSERGALYILHRLESAGEIEIERNDEGREIALRGGRRFRPKWFLHVRCVADWETYQTEGTAVEVKVVSSGVKRGRPVRKQSEKIANSNPQSFPSNPNAVSEKSEKLGSAYKEGSSKDPLKEEKPKSQYVNLKHPHQKPDTIFWCGEFFCVTTEQHFKHEQHVVGMGGDVTDQEWADWYADKDAEWGELDIMKRPKQGAMYWLAGQLREDADSLRQAS